MTCLLSQPAEALLEQDLPPSIDTLIVGSGYGAAMAAFALSEPASGVSAGDIWVLERGREYQPGEFPRVAAELPGHVMVTGTEVRTGERDALFDLKMGDGVSALVGSGLGGTSLINGGVAIDPTPQALAEWPARSDGRGWADVIANSAPTVKRLLGVTRADGATNVHPAPASLGKFRALGGMADGLRDAGVPGVSRVEGPEPVPLAISFSAAANAVGVQQPACVNCGNCITGCNVGAKNTLAMNVWPLVAHRGVRLFTGATVMTIVRADDGWRVRAVLTRHAGEQAGEVVGEPVGPVAAASGEDRATASFEVRVRRVILAAGTFGSTEILSRSRRAGLPLSDRLGQGFSVNGDMMMLGLRRGERVDAAARAPSSASDCADPAEDPVGPLTMAEVAVHLDPGRAGGAPRRISIQDGAVPYPLRRLFGELLTTEHVARLFVDGRVPQQPGPGRDPLAVDESLLAYSQLMTVMGREQTRGSLALQPLRSAPDRPPELVLRPTWRIGPEGRSDSYFAEVEGLFQAAEDHGGFDGGQMLPCPPWRMIPQGLEVLEGLQDLNRHLVTTHPLGGCCMAADAGEGVVDTRGQVFSEASGTATHPDLYVLDGAIVPGPIGVNPFMTIATLTHALAAELTAAAEPDAGQAEPVAAAAQPQPAWDAGCEQIPPGHGFPLADATDETVAGTLRERLFLDLEDQPSRTARYHARQLYRQLGLTDGERLVLDIETRCEDLYRWLDAPSRPLTARFRFARSLAKGDTVPDDALTPVGDGALAGQATLGGYQPPRNPLVREWRRLRTVCHFVRMRGDELLQRLRDGLGGEGGSLNEGVRFVRVSLRQALVQAAWRYMRYEFEGTVKVDGRLRRVRFLGQKTLAYRSGQLDPLNTLRTLPFTLSGRIPKPGRAPRFRVDMIGFTRDLAPFQAERSPDSPTTVLALASTALYFLRAIVQTHFWSFGAPSYGHYPSRLDVNNERLNGLRSTLAFPCEGASDTATVEVVTDEEHPGMRLLRYRPPGVDEPKPVLLIHGLAHGSRVFWTETVDRNLVQHLLGEGFDVWLLDHRLSCNLHREPDPHLSIEDIAAVDIPWAVRTVHLRVNAARPGSPVRPAVFAHCIGAGAFAIAALRGHLQSDETDPATCLVGQTVLHAVTPWLVASEDNRWRANAVSMFRSYFDDLNYDPIPHRDASIAESMADRFSSSFGWSRREFKLHRSCEHGRHFSRTICNRMTLFYGDEWIHENLDPRTHENLHTLVGPAPIEVLRQVYYCIVRGRLTNREGSNEYLRDDLIREHWQFPTLFIHGGANKVFDADGSRTSLLKLRAILGSADLPDPAVSLQVVPGYGHMDLLFGKHAHADVFPHIADFLGATRAVGARGAVPKSDVRPPLTPATGPIISAPRRTADGQFLTIWTELSQYTSRDPVVEYLRNDLPLPATLLAAPQRTSNGAAHPTAANGSALPPDPALVSTPPAARIQLARVKLDRQGVDGGQQDGSVDFKIHYRGDANLPSPTVERLDWQGLPWFRRAFTGSTRQDSVAFLAGSCLYPGAPAEQTLSDSVFARMRPLVEGRNGAVVDHLLLVGDQIYADATANLFDPAAPLERFRDRYRRAFGGPGRLTGANAHWIMSHVPTYFAVDDHEISDNWPEDLLRRRHPRGERYGPERELAFARGEAHAFMMHHGGPDERLWYSFESAGHPFFVFDTRSERTLGSRLSPDALLSAAQRAGFEAWLDGVAAPPGAHPIIVTGSPLGPLRSDQCRHPALLSRSDTLLGYPGFLVWLHDALTARGCRAVTWISGDAHLSCLGRYDLRLDDRAVQVRQVVASGLFAPLPFANATWRHLEGRVELSRTASVAGCERHLAIIGEQQLLSDSTAQFVHVTVAPDALTAQAHDRSGRASARLRIEDEFVAPQAV